MREEQHPYFPLTVYYAFKQTEDESDDDGDDDAVLASTGWETMLEGLIRAGFTVTGTWPMRTEGDNRQVGIGTNALASSIVLVCRPRQVDAPVATRRQFINALKQELPDALKRLQHGNIAPVDLAQAAIGPGIAIFSRYSKVLGADGEPMSVRMALQLINQELDAYLTMQEGELDRDTRFCLAWFEQYGMNEGKFSDADVMARAKNTAVQGLVDAGVVYAKAGKVRLLKRSEYPEQWNPNSDSRVAVWECTQQLIQRLCADNGGIEVAARLVNQLGSRSEDARALAYRLYSICERKKWADEALAYNTLVVEWPAIQEKAAQSRVMPTEQANLFR
jgi:putative DNA methylase